jgi:N4-gp56 family major capsid protein
MAYTPAGNVTSSAGLAHLASVYYKRKGLDRLQKKFHFGRAAYHDSLPKQEGRTVQWFRYDNYGANTTPTTEGTVGTSQSLTSRVVAATVSQYSSFITISDFLDHTAIDPTIENAADLLGYQAGLTVDTMTRNVIDSESTGTNQALLATYLRLADLRAAAHTLEGSDVERMDDGLFFVILHPFARFDLVNDPSANGLADIFKRQGSGSNPLFKMEDRDFVVSVADCRIITSTNVFTQTTPNRYRTYVFGKNGVGCVDLEGRAPSQVIDPKKSRFSIKTIRPRSGGEIADPEGVIGGAVSYNFVFAAVVTEGPAGIGGAYRYRTLDPQSTLVG